MDLYDKNDVNQIEVNVRTKARGLKKLLLEKVELYRKANIIIFKQNPTAAAEQPADAGQINSSLAVVNSEQWVPFTEEDYEKQIKLFQGQVIAFRAYMDITVMVDGRGQSYKT